MPYNILLVDDDRDFRREFKEFFRDYRVVNAGSGLEALEILREPNEIDLVILDVRLPDSRGTEILKKIKRIHPELGVIILTGFGTKQVVIEALKGEADEFLEKPLDTNKTETAIQNLLGKARWPEGIDAENIEGKMARVKTFVHRNRHKKVTLEDAAALVSLSPKYLSRVFKQATGEKFNDYKLSVKIEQAEEWLNNTGHSVDMIAFSLGYLNAESFIRIFKKYTGLTPGEYRGRKRRPAGKKK